MAVVELNFIPSGKTAKVQAKETLGYNGRRSGKDAEEVDRRLFGHGGELSNGLIPSAMIKPDAFGLGSSSSFKSRVRKGLKTTVSSPLLLKPVRMIPPSASFL